MKPLDILIVDDDVDHLEGLADIIEMEGHIVTSAFSGEEAVEKWGKQSFDLTFMDVKMAAMDGMEACSLIREIERNAVVIIITGFQIEDVAERAAECGAARILSKPLDIGQILDLMKNHEPEEVVLVADDDPDYTASVVQILSRASYRVRIAETGPSAVEQASSGSVDLLLLDLRMPAMNGLEVYTELKKRGFDVPTLVVTGYAEQESATVRQFQTGYATTCLKKPVKPELLLRSIEQLSPRRAG